MAQECGTGEMLVCGFMGLYESHLGSDGKMCKEDLRKFLREEMPNLCAGGDQIQLEDMFKELDQDGSGDISFKEFMGFMSTFCVICHDAAKQMMDARK